MKTHFLNKSILLLLLSVFFSYCLKSQSKTYETLQNYFLESHLSLDSLLRSVSSEVLSKEEKNDLLYFEFLFRNSLNQLDAKNLTQLENEKSNGIFFLLNYAESQLLYGNTLNSSDLEEVKKLLNHEQENIKGRAIVVYARNEILNRSYNSVLNLLIHNLSNLDPLIRGFSYQLIGKIYERKHQYQSAYENYQEALDWANENEYLYLKTKTSNLLGNVLLDLDKVELAEKAYISTLNEALALGNTRLQALGLANIGYIRLLQNQPNEAIDFFQRALIYLYKNKDINTIARIQKRLGEAYFLIGQYDLAINSYNLASDYFIELEDTFFVARTSFLYAQLFLETNKFDLAKKHLDDCLKYQELINDASGLLRTNELRSKWFLANRNYRDAFLSLRESNKIKDSIKTQEAKDRIDELDFLYKTEQKEKLISEQQNEIERANKEKLFQANKLENEQLRNRQLIYVSIILFIIVAFVIVFYNLKMKQTQLKRNQREVELRHAVLRGQMNPHFIFNAMSVIQGYIFENDVNASSKFLVNFSKLMRLILEHASKEFINLTIELEILERYLEVQQLRFEGRFKYQIKIEGNGLSLSEVMTPPMLVQPFIENAIEHGQLDKIKNGEVIILCKISLKEIEFVVSDNGIGYQNAQKHRRNKKHTSLATEITNQRLELLNQKYKFESSMQIDNLNKQAKTGTEVKIVVPYIKEENKI